MLLTKTEYTADLIDAGYVYDLSGRLEYLRKEIVRSFRQGADGRANRLLSEYVDEVLGCINRGSPVIDSAHFGLMTNEMLAAQQRHDTVRIADLMEYEMPALGLIPEGIQITDVSAVAELSKEGGKIICDVSAQAKGGTGEYEYKFFFGSDINDIKLEQDYSLKNQSLYAFNESNVEELLVKIWARCVGAGERFELESSVFLRIDPKDVKD